MPAGSRFSFEEWQAAYEGTPMTGEQICVFEIHSSTDCALIRAPLSKPSRSQKPASPGDGVAEVEPIDGGTALFLNRCLLLGPAARRDFPGHEDDHTFRFVSPTLGEWPYRVVRPTDEQYVQQFGFLRKASYVKPGYQVNAVNPPASPRMQTGVAAPALAQSTLEDMGGDTSEEELFERPRGG